MAAAARQGCQPDRRAVEQSHHGAHRWQQHDARRRQQHDVPVGSAVPRHAAGRSNSDVRCERVSWQQRHNQRDHDHRRHRSSNDRPRCAHADDMRRGGAASPRRHHRGGHVRRANSATDLHGCGQLNGLNVAVEPVAHMPQSPRSMGVAYDAHGGKHASKSRAVKDNFVNRVVDQCGPAVVRVEVEQKVKMPSVGDDDVFAFFFGVRPGQLPKERKVHAHGSGFCIDGINGIVLTNAHVVQGAERVTVSFVGYGSPFECQVLETDEVIDLAALRIRDKLKHRLPELGFGASEGVRTGDWAIVIGSPMGLRNTCTLGIVSSLDRSTGETGFDWMRHPLLQTDAAVNQGNSGGPLLNEIGEVIGMVSMRALFGEGIGFATPADTLRTAMPELIRCEKVPRAYLGLKMSATRSSDERRREGAFVELVLPRTPASQAGFREKDEIIELEGQRVKRFEDVQRAVRSAAVGSTLRFKVRREGKSREISVVTEDLKHLRKNSEGDLQAGNGGDGPRARIVIVPRPR